MMHRGSYGFWVQNAGTPKRQNQTSANLILFGPWQRHNQCLIWREIRRFEDISSIHIWIEGCTGLTLGTVVIRIEYVESARDTNDTRKVDSRGHGIWLWTASSGILLLSLPMPHGVSYHSLLYLRINHRHVGICRD